MFGPRNENVSLYRSRDKRIGEIMRSAGLPLGMAILRYAVVNGTSRMQELSDSLGYSIHSCRTTMSKMLKLGLFAKSGTFARGIVYDLTHEGLVVAKCLEELITINDKETK